ncbi:prolipoprotein diacylglyceryl transferase family protein [Pseudoprimorskyibacter insulae]|uniref:Prolipoprotein diacylglyceryl transferase n=1 Tax=Pseudoprimorskyibacter insulae TaxID=1695997 RepID=A0A2R8AVU3_9RHOB|nr:prolipoprotein diacylglyceryl transferase family protein [Pseudoprimorskyibacter insulae]SPF80136.1 Prolipoprotein diacylglyceryl transferase [Pseudoprimorskyibacter insulae]
MLEILSIHMIFDLLAAASSLGVTALVLFWGLRKPGLGALERAGAGYPLALIGGAVVGAYAMGSINLWLMGEPALGRSILGAVIGAISAVEIYKLRAGLRGSTGAPLAAGFAASVMVGRWGCFLTGLPDQTFGIATTLPWAVDFGDGIPRHPVQIYESAAMGLCLILALLMLWRRPDAFSRYGFYGIIGIYGAQRFVWEFLKPYPPVLGPFNLFHIGCAALVLYAVSMSKWYVRP